MQQPPRPKSLLATTAILLGAAFSAAAAPSAATRSTVSEVYGKLPLSFEANQGQVDQEVQFLCRGRGYTLFLSRDEAEFRMNSPQHETNTVRLQLAGGNRHPRVSGEGLLSMRSNYFLGSDPLRWHSGVRSYARVHYHAVYPGVDLVYRGNQRHLEYDFVIAPRADPGLIHLAFRGAALNLGSQGELILQTANGGFVQPPPEMYQEMGGRREHVDGHYVLLSANHGVGDDEGAPHQVGFVVGRYDRNRPLIIDPVLAYSTFLGGTGDDFGAGIALDGGGNAYVTGSTSSATFPGVTGTSIQPAFTGGLDVFVTKINSTGTAIVYSTFLGGTNGSEGRGIAVDNAGNAYVTGSTSSPNFPGVNAGSIQSSIGGGPGNIDAFVTKINSAGTAIVYSTFLGGTAEDRGQGIAVDGAGNAYLTGFTSSPAFPGVSSSSIQPANGGGANDAFVTKINSAGTAIIYSTFLGGTGMEVGRGIAVDSTGNAYVTGPTDSAAFPGVNTSSIQPVNRGGPAGLDAFVTKLNATGTAIVYSTFLGGSGNDGGAAIAVDGSANAYVTGFTTSTTFPGVGSSSVQPVFAGATDAFVTKINPTGSAIVYSTFLGGNGNLGGDSGTGIAVDSAGNAYVTGTTDSTTFPGVGVSSIQPINGGIIDAFVTKIDSTGTVIVYSTFLGGSGNDLGASIAVDTVGNAYVAGFTNSTAFPGVSTSSIQSANAGGFSGFDAFVTKIAGVGLGFHTLTPCRIVDTRNTVGPLGGPALQPGAVRIFVVTGVCGVPLSAKALSVNLTVIQPVSAGDLRLFPGDVSTPPLASVINYAAGQIRANNAVAGLALDGSGSVKAKTDSTGSANFVLDVNGYFE